MPPPLSLSGLSRPELEALLVELFGEVAALKQMNSELREELARLKGLKGRPKIGPSGMDKGTETPKPNQLAKRRGRGKVTPRVSIEEEAVSAPVPPGSRFKGYGPFLVQDLVISVRATCYQRERWATPDGRTVLARLPDGTEGHFGPELRRFVLMQYHQGKSTLPLHFMNGSFPVPFVPEQSFRSRPGPAKCCEHPKLEERRMIRSWRCPPRGLRAPAAACWLNLVG